MGVFGRGPPESKIKNLKKQASSRNEFWALCKISSLKLLPFRLGSWIHTYTWISTFAEFPQYLEKYNPKLNSVNEISKYKSSLKENKWNIVYSYYPLDSGIGVHFGCISPQNPRNFVNKTGTNGQDDLKISVSVSQSVLNLSWNFQIDCSKIATCSSF